MNWSCVKIDLNYYLFYHLVNSKDIDVKKGQTNVCSFIELLCLLKISSGEYFGLGW